MYGYKTVDDITGVETHYNPEPEVVMHWIRSEQVVTVEDEGEGVFTAYKANGWEFSKTENGDVSYIPVIGFATVNP